MKPLSGTHAAAGAAHGAAALRLADRLDGAVALLCKGVLMVTGTVLMLVLSANVVARYGLATGGFDWAEEVPEQIFPWFIMGGVALAVPRGGHVAVEWLLGRLRRGGRRAVLLAGYLLVFIAYGVLGWQAMEVAGIVAIERSPVLGLSRSYGYWAVAFGSVLIALGTATTALRVALLGPETMPQPRPEEQPT